MKKTNLNQTQRQTVNVGFGILEVLQYFIHSVWDTMDKVNLLTLPFYNINRCHNFDRSGLVVNPKGLLEWKRNKCLPPLTEYSYWTSRYFVVYES